jgi:predicted O-methyltransferase YrrM
VSQVWRLWEIPRRVRDMREQAREAPRLEAEVQALQTRVHELELHANHVEKRLHEAEYEKQLSANHVEHLEARLHEAEQTLKRFADVGLRVNEAADPDAFARWLTWRAPGHFYSPIPNLRELEMQADVLWPPDPPPNVPGVDLNAEEQLSTFSQVAELARTVELHEHKTDPWRYYSDNVAYNTGDALTLSGLLRLIRPRRLIEIGSGYSSAMTLDTVEHYLDGQTELTFVEPYPELLESLMRPGDRDQVTIIPTPLQQVPAETFLALQSGDVLFIDSTHVVKTGSDVTWLYSNVLPLLNEGVWLHIHDIFYPFEYRKDWVFEGRAWSEAYLVRAFLTCNPEFRIMLFNDWLATFHRDRIAAELPTMLTDRPGALWLHRSAKSDRAQ